MLSFSRSFLKLVLNIVFLAQIQNAIFLVMALVTVRYLQEELFGVLQYFAAVASLPTMFCSHFPHGVSRFVPTVEGRRKSEILVASILLQLGIVLAVLVVAISLLYVFPGLRFWKIDSPLRAQQTTWALVFVVVFSPSIVLQTTLQSFLAGLQKIRLAQTLGVGISFLQLGAVGAIWLLVDEPSQGLLLILAARVLTQLAGALLVVLYLVATSSLASDVISTGVGRWPGLCLEFFQEFSLSYTMPLQIAAIFTFLREHLAILLLGRAGLLTEVTYFNIVQKFYEAPRKLIPHLVRTLIPRIVVQMRKGDELFRAQFRQLSWLQFGFHAAVGSLILALWRPILGLFSIEPNQTLFWLFFLFSLSFLLSSIGLAASYPFQFGRDTTKLMRVSIARSCVLSVLTLVLVSLYGSVGGGIALVISSALASLLLTVFATDGHLWSLRDGVEQTAASLGVVSLWLLVLRLVRLPW